MFILEGVDRVDPEAADALLDILDPEHRTAFRDRYVVSPFDLSSVLWLVTATAPEAIPESVRARLELIELAGYGEDEKLERSRSATCWRVRSMGPGRRDGSRRSRLRRRGPDRAAAPAVAVDGAAVPVRDLERWSAGVPALAAETWRTAASGGHVRFEDDAVRLLIRAHTDEAGVTELGAKLAAVCREVVFGAACREQACRPWSRRPSCARCWARAPASRCRRRCGRPSRANAGAWRTSRKAAPRRRTPRRPTTGSSSWEKLPWTRRGKAPVDLAQARAALDADHAGLEQAKACILEHLAVRRRNPRGSGAAICLVGPPGVGKTSLAQCTARALGRGFVKLACGGLRDETDLRGHNRTWRDAQPGVIVRELQAGRLEGPGRRTRRDSTSSARETAAVLLEVLDPAAERRLPRRLRRAAVRPLGGALHHDGERARPDPPGAARPARDRRRCPATARPRRSPSPRRIWSARRTAPPGWPRRRCG